nr:3401_t:CDS:2 [Entrophospora candida]
MSNQQTPELQQRVSQLKELHEFQLEQLHQLQREQLEQLQPKQLQQQLKQLQERIMSQLKLSQDEQKKAFLSFLQQQTCLPPQQSKKDKIGPRRYSLLACDSCNKGHQACVIEKGSTSCNRCIGKKKCTFVGDRRKRGRKSPKEDEQKESCDNSNVNIINVAVGDQCCYSSSEPIPDLREGVPCIFGPDIVIDKANLKEDNSLDQWRVLFEGGSFTVDEILSMPNFSLSF